MNDERVKTLGATLAAGEFKAARSPGPIYQPRYDFLSTNKAEPGIPFGTGVRQPGVKDEGSGPGPGAYPLPAVQDSLRPILFRGREKFGSIIQGTSKDVPGPGEYVRLDTHQTRKDMPRSISLKGRPAVRQQNLYTPAPSAHQKPQPINKYSHLSNKKNAPSIKFGQVPRSSSASAIRKQYTSNPAPCDYYGAEVEYVKLSTVQTAPAFSLSARFPSAEEKSKARIQPDFHKPMEGIGKQPLSTHKTLPSPSFSGRTKFGSPYFM